MRKLLLALLLCALFVGGFFVFIAFRIFDKVDNNMSVSVRENGDTYQFFASYNRHNTKRVQRYMDHILNNDRNFFRNAKMDGDVKLDNAMNLYVKCRPGMLIIKMDKTKNDSVSYARMKELAEDLKRKISEDAD